MELRHLRYFVAVAETENVSRAALKLHVSQPGLSRQIRDLEEDLGFALFERSAKSVKSTVAGHIFFKEAQAVLTRLDEGMLAARKVGTGGHGELHIGYAPSLTARILPPALRAFQAELPNVRVRLHDLSTEEMLTGLRADKLNLALVVRVSEKKLRGLRFVELARYALCVAVAPGHPFARLRRVKRAAVAGEPLIVYDRENYPEYHDSLEKLYGESGLKPQIAEEHEGGSGLVAAVEAGRGIALVPDCLACAVGPRLKLIPLVPAGLPIIVGAAVKKGPIPAGVEKFITAALAKPGKN